MSMKRRYGGGDVGETEGADIEEWMRGRFGNDGGLRGTSSPKRGKEERSDVGNKGTSAAGEGVSRARGRGGGVVTSKTRSAASEQAERKDEERRTRTRLGEPTESDE